MNKRTVGSEYELIACRHLESAGMQILECNYRVRIGEIDIIARDADALVFVEVKYRTNKNFGGAMFAISQTKKNKIRRVAQWYMAEHHIRPSAFCRFDAVLIDGMNVTHIKNAW